MSILLQFKAAIITLFLLGFMLFPVCFLAAPFPLKYRLKVICPFWKIFATLVLKWGTHSKLAIQEDNRSPEFKTNPSHGLYIANHQSFVDIPLMATMFQIPPIMKKEVLYLPIFGLVAWASGAMPVSRSRGDSRKKVFKMCRDRLLKEKLAVQYYPEGTRSKDGRPKSFEQIKTALIQLAYNNNTPVIACSLYGTSLVLTNKGKINSGKHLGIKIHQEIYPKDYASYEEFVTTCWNKVTDGYQELEAKLAHLN